MKQMLFSRRREIDLEFKKWCEEKKAEYCVMNFIAWLHTDRRDLLKEIAESE